MGMVQTSWVQSADPRGTLQLSPTSSGVAGLFQFLVRSSCLPARLPACKLSALVGGGHVLPATVVAVGARRACLPACLPEQQQPWGGPRPGHQGLPAAPACPAGLACRAPRARRRQR